jgi:hypothetical protein
MNSMSMQEPMVTMSLHRECLEPFEIHERHAVRAVNSPDDSDVVWQSDLALGIHVKQMASSHPPYSLLVIEQIQHGERQLNLVLKVFPDLCPDFASKAPLEILEAIANRFGIVVRIGRKQAMFFREERIPALGPGDIEVFGETTERARLNRIPQIYCGVDEGPPPMANCALAFCLDVPKYRAWLRTHKPAQRSWTRRSAS